VSSIFFHPGCGRATFHPSLTEWLSNRVDELLPWNVVLTNK
ncbi:hypothetical protein, partial [Escherichia coli]